MTKQIERGTYRVTFKDTMQIIVGNNYKSWITHASEFASWRYGKWGKGKMTKEQIAEYVDSVEYTEIEFVDNGCLKYAAPNAYEYIINSETRKDGKYRTPYNLLKDEFIYSLDDKLKLKRVIRSLW